MDRTNEAGFVPVPGQHADGESLAVLRVPAATNPEVVSMAQSLRTLCVVELLLAVLALFFNYTMVIIIIPTDIIGIMACRYLRKQALVMFSILKLFGVVILVWNSSYILSGWQTCSDCAQTSHLPLMTVLLFVGLFYQFCCVSLARRLYVKLTLLELQDPASAHVELGNLHADQQQEHYYPSSEPQQEFFPAERYLPTEHFQPGQSQPYPPYGYYPQFAPAPGYAYPPGAVPQFVPPVYHSVMMPYPTAFPALAPPAGEGQESAEVNLPTHIVIDQEGQVENKHGDKETLL